MFYSSGKSRGNHVFFLPGNLFFSSGKSLETMFFSPGKSRGNHVLFFGRI